MGKILNFINRFFCICPEPNLQEKKKKLAHEKSVFESKKKITWSKVLKENKNFSLGFCVHPDLLEQLKNKNKDGLTIWHIAIKYKARCFLESLIESKKIQKAHIDTPNNNGETPFFYTMQYLDKPDAFKFLRILISGGATTDFCRIKSEIFAFNSYDPKRDIIEENILQYENPSQCSSEQLSGYLLKISDLSLGYYDDN